MKEFIEKLKTQELIIFLISVIGFISIYFLEYFSYL